MIYCLSDIGTTTDLLITSSSSEPIQVGANPAPLYATQCPNASSTGTTTVFVNGATVDNPVFDLFCGILIIYLVAYGVIGFFRKK